MQVFDLTLEVSLELCLLFLQRQSCGGVQEIELPFASAIELQDVVVVLPQRGTMRDSEEGNPLINYNVSDNAAR